LTTYYLNGHNFIEQELNRKKITFRKNDNAFLAVDDVGALQGAADKLSPAIIRERLDYWTLILGPKFSAKWSGAADAPKLLADVVRLSIVGPAAHVAKAVGHRDAGRQLRVGAVPVQVIDSEIRPVTLRQPEESARFVSPCCFRAG
jgi:hypothetical protein